MDIKSRILQKIDSKRNIEGLTQNGEKIRLQDVPKTKLYPINRNDPRLSDEDIEHIIRKEGKDAYIKIEGIESVAGGDKIVLVVLYNVYTK